MIVTTLMSSATSLLNRMTFETLIIDEASQTTEPESWIAIGKAERVSFWRVILFNSPYGKDSSGVKPRLTKTLMDTLLEKNILLIYWIHSIA